MDQDTLTYDTIADRPLPKWLTDQRDGLNTWQPEKIWMKEDNSIAVSFAITGIIILLTVAFLTLSIIRKKRRK